MEDHRSDAELLRDPRIYRLIMDAASAAEERGMRSGYDAGRQAGFQEGYRAHVEDQEEQDRAWIEATPDPAELRRRARAFENQAQHVEDLKSRQNLG